MHDCDTYFNAWPRFMTRTIYVLGGPTYDDIDGLDGTIYVDILGPAEPLMYPDQISCYRLHQCTPQKNFAKHIL